MTEIKEGLFHLATDRYSYILNVNKHGFVQLAHFGAPLMSEDAEALALRPGLGWGSSVLYDEQDMSCLDALALDWSGSGRGDYRESPVEIFEEGRPMPTDFVYVSHRLLPALPPMACTLPQPDGEAETLELTLRHGDDMELKLYYSAYEDVLCRRAVLTNISLRALELGKLMSFCADLKGSFELVSFDGGWIAETHKSTTPVGRSRVARDSVTGASSNRNQPGFLLASPGAREDTGSVYGFNLIYSGNHYASAQCSQQGLTRVMQGINPSNFRRTLAPGESFETPVAVLSWSGAGFNGLSGNFHRFINSHIVPAYWRGRPRPVLYNSWEGCFFDFDQRKLLNLGKKAAKLGCELFVLDDGWFGARNDDHAGLGDYDVNTKKLPGGLSQLAGKLAELGLDFGLWIEPESVNEDSRLFRAHPDWALTDSLRPLYGRHQLLLDLTKKEVRDYIVDSVSSVLDSADISYIKWDMNRHSIALGAKAHDFVLGLYEVLGRIFGPRPDILFESCSSGGNRFDLGMLCFSPQIWASDDTDPIERLEIQEGLSYLYPMSTMGAHVSAAPHAQTLRNTPLSTRGNVSFFGLLGYELDLRHLLPVEETEIKNQIAFYKEHRDVFQFGQFRRVENPEHRCWQVSKDDVHIAGVFHGMERAAPGYEYLRMTGLEKNRRYAVANRQQKLRVGQFGALVKHIAPVDLDPNGVVLRTVDHRYAMDDGSESFSASGAALDWGVALNPRFMGTGYDKALRVQGDMSSYVYVAVPEKEQE